MPVQQEAPTLIEVRNRATGLVIFTDQHENVQVTWQAAGDPSGEDVQMLSGNVLNNPDFRRVVSNGVLELVDPEVAAQAHIAKRKAFEGRQAAGAAAVAEVVHVPEDHDFVGLPCIGPGTRAGASCDTLVTMVAADADSTPPLCDRHQRLRNDYERTDDGTWHRKET